MSFDDLRRSLEQLDAVVNEDKLEAERDALLEENLQLKQKIKQLQAKNLELERERDRLRAKAQLKDTEIHSQAQALAEDMLHRWHIETKPGVVASAVEEGVRREIGGYPYNCSEYTVNAINLASNAIYDRVVRRSWWYPILFAPAVSSPAPEAAVTPKKLTFRVIPIQKKAGQDQVPSTGTRSTIQPDGNGKADTVHGDTVNP